MDSKGFEKARKNGSENDGLMAHSAGGSERSRQRKIAGLDGKEEKVRGLRGLEDGIGFGW
jgi:hypothetical protein